jgi:hypothetical protein
LICIDGISGIGKTSLALEVVSECLDASKNKLKGIEKIESDIPLFEGFIWTSAKDRELKLNDVMMRSLGRLIGLALPNSLLKRKWNRCENCYKLNVVY